MSRLDTGEPRWSSASASVTSSYLPSASPSTPSCARLRLCAERRSTRDGSTAMKVNCLLLRPIGRRSLFALRPRRYASSGVGRDQLALREMHSRWMRFRFEVPSAAPGRRGGRTVAGQGERGTAASGASLVEILKALSIDQIISIDKRYQRPKRPKRPETLI